ncbi:hypothetical protein ACF0H5_012048 [Mactra antiquata]
MKYLVILLLVKFVVGGYLPPPDYGNSSPNCACDEEVMSLADRISKLEIDLDHQRTRSNILEKSIQQQSRNRRQVDTAVPPAFTAYLSHYYNAMSIGDTIVFDKTLTNVGGYYNLTTGRFTAPLSGLYIFSFIIETKHAVDTAVRLVVDGNNALDAVVEPRHNEQNLQGGNVGILTLSEGQQVWIQIYNTGGQTLEGGNIYRFTTFTGALLSEMDVTGPTMIG